MNTRTYLIPYDVWDKLWLDIICAGICEGINNIEELGAHVALTIYTKEKN